MLLQFVTQQSEFYIVQQNICLYSSFSCSDIRHLNPSLPSRVLAVHDHTSEIYFMTLLLLNFVPCHVFADVSARNFSYHVFNMWHQIWFQNTFHWKWAVIQGDAVSLNTWRRAWENNCEIAWEIILCRDCTTGFVWFPVFYYSCYSEFNNIGLLNLIDFLKLNNGMQIFPQYVLGRRTPRFFTVHWLILSGVRKATARWEGF